MKTDKFFGMLGLVSAFLISISASANDGMGIFVKKEANNPDGKILSAWDVVLNRELSTSAGNWRKSVMQRKGWERAQTAAFPKAFTKDQSMYVIKAEGDTLCIAQGGNGIVYGESVSRNEFGIMGGIFMAPDRSKVAFYRKDESRVHLFPLLDITQPQGGLNAIRYPMAGTPNSEKIDLYVYDFATSSTTVLDVEGEYGSDQYLTNISWNPCSDVIYIQLLDRAQQNMKLNSYDAASGRKIATLLTEHSDTWVEPQKALQWIKGSTNKAIYATDNRDGFWNLYLVDTDKVPSDPERAAPLRLTAVDKDVEYVANDGKYLYFTAPDLRPVNNYLWRVNMKNGKIEQMTTEEGWHSVVMSPDCQEYVDIYQNVAQAPKASLKRCKDNKVIEVLQEPQDPTSDYAYTEVTLSNTTSANGRDINFYRLVKPKDFDPSKKYPLIVYVYGGPHSQMVNNTFLAGYRRWEMYMAQRGFVVFVMDNRGTQRHGAAYEHSIYRQCGQNEMADQRAALDMLMEIPWIDKDRIGVYGWSYGGFMSLSLATNYPDIFKVCVAGGPVIDWKWYEVMYGERYMSTPQKNPEGFAKTSLLNSAKNLKAKTLVIQGAVDPTVVPLNALSFVQECINNGIQVEYFTYPKGEHNMVGNDRVHLVEKVSQHFIDNL